MCFDISLGDTGEEHRKWRERTRRGIEGALHTGSHWRKIGMSWEKLQVCANEGLATVQPWKGPGGKRKSIETRVSQSGCSPEAKGSFPWVAVTCVWGRGQEWEPEQRPHWLRHLIPCTWCLCSTQFLLTLVPLSQGPSVTSHLERGSVT